MRLLRGVGEWHVCIYVLPTQHRNEELLWSTSAKELLNLCIHPKAEKKRPPHCTHVADALLAMLDLSYHRTAVQKSPVEKWSLPLHLFLFTGPWVPGTSLNVFLRGTHGIPGTFNCWFLIQPYQCSCTTSQNHKEVKIFVKRDHQCHFPRT